MIHSSSSLGKLKEILGVSRREPSLLAQESSEEVLRVSMFKQAPGPAETHPGAPNRRRWRYTMKARLFNVFVLLA